jgi:hypothetical protein
MKLEENTDYVGRDGRKITSWRVFGGFWICYDHEDEVAYQYHDNGHRRWADVNDKCDIIGPWVEQPDTTTGVPMEFFADNVVGYAMDENGAWYSYTKQPDPPSDKDPMWGSASQSFLIAGFKMPAIPHKRWMETWTPIHRL